MHNMLRFSSPAVVADGYGKRKVVESLVSLNQGGDGQIGEVEGGLGISEADFCLNPAGLEIVAKE